MNPAGRGLVLSVAIAATGLTGCEGEVVPDCVRESGSICTVAGTGIPGDGADGFTPLGTRLYAPADVAFNPAGRMVIVDWNNHRIREQQANGLLKIVAGEGELATGLFGGDDDVSTRLNHPTDVTFDPQGRCVIAAWHNSRVKRINPANGKLEDIAGTGARGFGGDGATALSAVLNLPASVLYDPAGNLYISDQANQRIRIIEAGGEVIRTFAGTGMRGFAGDGGPALQATFNQPVGQQGEPAAHIARHPDGSIFLADTDNNRIRRIDPTGMVSTVAGTGVAGAKGEGVRGEEAELDHPVDVAVGPDGDLYIADTENNCVRVLRQGVISTVAGTCGQCSGQLDDPCRCPATDPACIGDGGPARNSHLKRPFGIAFDREGNLYVADTLNYRVRVIYK